MNEVIDGQEREAPGPDRNDKLTTRDVVAGAAHAAQFAEVGGPATHVAAQSVGVADAAMLAKDSLEGKEVRAMDVAAAAASVTMTADVGGPAAQTAAKAVAAVSALDAGERAMNSAREALGDDSREVAVASLVKTALEHQREGRLEDAAIAAYEAGRYGTSAPTAVVQDELLNKNFSKGAVDAVQDARDQERADALLDAGFEPKGPAQRGALSAEAERLQAPNESRLGTASNAYVEIEMRAAAAHEMRQSSEAQREDEPNGQRWAREDVNALQHVRTTEQSVALDAMARSMEANKGYAQVISQEFPDTAKEIEVNRAARETAGLEAGQLSVVAAMRDRSRWDLDDNAAPDMIQRVAREDLEDLRRLNTPERLDDASTVIAGNMRNPVYKAEFERLDKEAAQAVELLASQAGEKVVPDAEKRATLTIDDTTLERLSAVRERDSDEALKSLGIRRNDDDINDRFVANLDARMEKSQLEELGWRNRDDLDDVMRDLERLAGKDWQRAAQLWDKYRPGDIDKPVFIDGDDIAEKKAGRGQQNEPDKTNDTARSADRPKDDDAEFVTPEALRKRFLQAENKFYFRDEENKLAFEDKGKRLATEHNDPEIARSMVELAEAKGWNSIKLKGTDEFKREVWLQASLKGMEVQGFQPRDVDLAKLEDLRKETGRSADKGMNIIDQAPERARQADRQESRQESRSQSQAPADIPDRAAVVDEHQRTLSDKQRQVIDTVKAIMRERGDSDKAISMAAEMAAERFQNNRVYVGKMLDHGEAPYEHKKDNEPSYYVKLETSSGEKTVWGVDLKRALTEGKSQPGDDVVIAYQGKQEVPVTVKERDAQGKVIGETQIMANRNTWDVRQLESLREEAKERVLDASSKAELQPLVKVYDRDAPRSEARAEPTREPARENERARG
ncbi:LPD7 domain-containing protein [Aquabacterium sp. CECT 9606]|uniref:LPD7 domain-containing protein n=1 Tax=Aquabacterium sp. CECT 9606 TaxID=2845822 RepID=UPI001E5DEFE1|nr:LPD7 domain-containing protein [Aquabacterium sp. CECT 9606]CAH0356066.1 hypothetical protein AQB9606_04529 [Aquabacterium sp. CECT 9606]